MQETKRAERMAAATVAKKAREEREVARRAREAKQTTSAVVMSEQQRTLVEGIIRERRAAQQQEKGSWDDEAEQAGASSDDEGDAMREWQGGSRHVARHDRGALLLGRTDTLGVACMLWGARPFGFGVWSLWTVTNIVSKMCLHCRHGAPQAPLDLAWLQQQRCGGRHSKWWSPGSLER